MATSTPSNPLLGLSLADATMHNAIEFLAQGDSESALVYAIVHDPEFRLAAALLSNAATKTVNLDLVRALLQVFESYEDQFRRFLGMLMLREMMDTINWNELFRANSATTALIREYTCELGLDFLQSCFQDVLAEIWDMSESCEVNPLHLEPTDDLAANQQRLEELAQRILDKIFDSFALFPYQIAKIYRVMEVEMTRLIERDRKSNNSSMLRLSSINEDPSDAAIADALEDLTNGGSSASDSSDGGRKSSASLPRLSAISEELLFNNADGQKNGGAAPAGAAMGPPRASWSSGLSEGSGSVAKEEFYVHLGGFLFLRYLCPALIMPHRMQLTPNGEVPSKTLQRTLVLIAKIFQSLANNVEYGSREEYMVPFNAFLVRNRSRLFRFYDQICQQAQNDSRRESLIIRSNVTPRISQLWGGTSGTSAYGLIGDQPLLSSVEEALGVIQRWIGTNVQVLVKEVAVNGKDKRQTAAGDLRLSAGRGSTRLSENQPPPAAIVDSPTKTKTKSTSASDPKRTLKTAKSGPVPPPPTVVPSDNDEDNTDGEEEEDLIADVPEKTEKRAPETLSVSKEELERVIGLTSHRDIQLMKIYYSNLSKNGLQRLLKVNDPAHASSWTLYKSRNNVDVFYNRASPSTSNPKDRFVEMKAHIEIKSTPRHVFKYLRSLEKMTEWDDRVANLRKVEPLDESRVVMYRAHPKLSLWPTWLVKPRDSCDLHSFVRKTGRADTYAVLMESVPRPDVPEIKGTVRMAYATGGFLVEPSPSDPMETKLTCLIKADFKGRLPRYLAESVCFRQVLSVRVIKMRLEGANQHVDSTWV
ncbi:hypothetical protein Poli38472_011384 [Pythium oligandrum]|uniref:Uncharacterized protein n=1 Tax=Pythium oligandrum TaxID=41045 RepID=A0A8K1CK21_PYTOL|nr:hypothetical protein Poli38472_011384 [Pythium oligandrum]|eukprot:TMW64504.1 hypothetical protein Poli38472_011384 [Pythium oligandrum]